MNNTALLIIDVQNDYFPGGKMSLPGAKEAAAAIQKVLEKCRDIKVPVFHIQHESRKEGATFFLPGTDGQKIYKDVSPLQGETVICKHSPNSFLHTDLYDLLHRQKIKSLIITGMMTFMCVDATARAAADLGFDCTLLLDCTATPPTEFAGVSCSSAQAKAAFLHALSFICTEVTTADTFITMLSKNQ